MSILKWLSCFTILTQAFAYYGRHSTEAMLSFEGRIEIATSIQNLQDLKKTVNKKAVLKQIHEQLQFHLGTFTSDSFKLETGDATAAIGNGKIEEIVKITHVKKSKPGHSIFSYQYEDKIVAHRDFFGPDGSRMESEIPIKLPFNLNEIYGLTVKRILVPSDEHDPESKKVYRYFSLCTDEHYNSEGDLFYFWDPDRINSTGRSFSYEDCPLKDDHENIVRTKGRLKRLKNSWQKYLEYDRLYGPDQNGVKKDLKVYILLGYMNDVENFEQTDLEDQILEGLAYIQTEILERGFQETQSAVDKKFDSFKKRFLGKGINRYYRYQKHDVLTDPIYSKTKKAVSMNVDVHILVSDTALNSPDPTFHHFYREAMREGDLVVYDGHSGLGANLNLDYLKASLAPANKYQVIFLNGCSGYPYFKDMYFNHKKGKSQNLDLILSGISTYSDTVGPNVMGFLEGFLEGKTLNTSYILKKIEEASFDMNGSYLTGILGEEDNQWEKVE